MLCSMALAQSVLPTMTCAPLLRLLQLEAQLCNLVRAACLLVCCRTLLHSGVAWLVSDRHWRMLLMKLCLHLLHVLDTCLLLARMLLVVLLVRHVAVLKWHWLLDRRLGNNAAMRAVWRWRHGEPTDALALRRATRVLPLRRRGHACCWCMALPWRHCMVLLLLRTGSHSGCVWVTMRVWPLLCMCVRCLRASLGSSSARGDRQMRTGIALG
jgi:hypothetical protein